MTQTFERPLAATPTVPAAFLRALPAIAMLSVVIWLFVGIFAWLTAGFLGSSSLALASSVVLFAAPGLWATWRVIVLAVGAERDGGEDRMP